MIAGFHQHSNRFELPLDYRTGMKRHPSLLAIFRLRTHASAPVPAWSSD